MKNNEITIGQNLKRIRKGLNLRQYEIAGEQVTRNLISLIENDRTPIYHNVATIISKNMNKIIHERGIDIYIQPEDILNPNRYDARKQANFYIEKLQHHLDEKIYDFELEELNKIETFLNKWNFIDKKVKTYDLLGDIYYNAKDSIREYYYYLKALEVSYEYPYMKRRYKIILKLVYNCILTKKFDEAIRLCNFALSTQDDIPNKYIGVFYYNSGLASYHKGDYSECLEQLIHAKYYVTYDDYREIKRILMLEGICNSKIKNFDGALRSYNKLLKIIGKSETPEEMCSTYINIVQVYTEKKDNSNVVKYSNKVTDYIAKIDKNSYQFPRILLSMSYIYYYLNKYETCEKYLNEALTLSVNHEDTTLFPDVFSRLIDFYVELKQYNKINNLTKLYKDKICSLKLSKDSVAILKILYNFIELDNSLEAKHLIRDLLDGEVKK
ncbi:hypothetical protein [Schnuerera sp.]|uniref:hypothetical protein n=1 Tax=Schnuerera sp. TaxID=2794844 RepID=UPI002CAE16A9|nr:hypothetical protein [Schnuerera sp.]HSH34814.1 hypothetical protein [Schnuerera sp.]